MKVRVIGDGGAFDVDKINSSFLITTEEITVLVDCGYNVFPELVRLDKEGSINMKDIDCVLITHMDDDHIGSLKTFLYYRYFILGSATTVYGNNNVLEYLNNINKEMKSSKYEKANIVISKNIYNEVRATVATECFSFIPCLTEHHEIGFGFVIIVNEENTYKIVAISGDTKANYKFETIIRKIANSCKIPFEEILLFHDFSYWDVPSCQVHACESDFNIEYSEEFRNKAILYHNKEANIAGKIYKL